MCARARVCTFQILHGSGRGGDNSQLKQCHFSPPSLPPSSFLTPCISRSLIPVLLLFHRHSHQDPSFSRHHLHGSARHRARSLNGVGALYHLKGSVQIRDAIVSARRRFNCFCFFTDVPIWILKASSFLLEYHPF